MELVTSAALNRAARREILAGKEYLVTDVVMLVPGVLAGSKGPLYYPHDEVARNHDAWNGMPLTLYHPTDDAGRPASGRKPSIVAKHGLGHVYDVSIRNSDGALVGKGWFDVAEVKRKDTQLTSSSRLYPRLVSGKPIEVSTGLYTDNVPARNGAHHNGRTYAFVARNYRPDHLAILPDQQGACSVRDGCGVSVTNSRRRVMTPTEAVAVLNANPKGCNQYTGSSCGVGGKLITPEGKEVGEGMGKAHDRGVATKKKLPVGSHAKDNTGKTYTIEGHEHGGLLVRAIAHKTGEVKHFHPEKLTPVGQTRNAMTTAEALILVNGGWKSQPRDKVGRWTDGGGTTTRTTDAVKGQAHVTPDEKAISKTHLADHADDAKLSEHRAGMVRLNLKEARTALKQGNRKLARLYLQQANKHRTGEAKTHTTGGKS